MNSSVLDVQKAIMVLSQLKKPFDLVVEGTSMLPILHPGDIISVCRKDHYEVGDILVFVYKKNELLVHRLLKFENGKYFCKGDNSFRLEDVFENCIIGAVLLEDDPHKTDEYIENSYKMNRIFRNHKYDVERTQNDPKYIQYLKKYMEI